jgi:hypothetical protein
MTKIIYILLIHFLLLLIFTSYMVLRKKDYPIIVGLTSFPGREKSIGKSINTILKQTKLPDKIIISICHDYKRFPNILYDERYLEKYKNNEKILIHKCQDYGPMTKLFGILDYYNNKKIKLKNSLIILMCDDCIYKPWVIEKIHERFKLNPKRAYCYSLNYNYANKCDVIDGNSAPSLNSNMTKNMMNYYNSCIEYDHRLFSSSDLVFSKYLVQYNYELVKLTPKKGIGIYSPIPGSKNSISCQSDELSIIVLKKIKIPKFSKKNNKMRHSETQHSNPQHCETQHNETQHCGAQHNETQHCGAQYCETQHSETQHCETQHCGAQHNETQNNETQHCGAQHCGAQHNETQNNETQHCGAQHCETQHCETQHCGAQHCETQHNETQHSNPQHCETQHCGAQHNETQHSNPQHCETQHCGAQHCESQHCETQHCETQHCEVQHCEAQHDKIQRYKT